MGAFLICVNFLWCLNDIKSAKQNKALIWITQENTVSCSRLPDAVVIRCLQKCIIYFICYLLCILYLLCWTLLTDDCRFLYLWLSGCCCYTVFESRRQTNWILTFIYLLRANLFVWEICRTPKEMLHCLVLILLSSRITDLMHSDSPLGAPCWAAAWHAGVLCSMRPPLLRAVLMQRGPPTLLSCMACLVNYPFYTATPSGSAPNPQLPLPYKGQELSCCCLFYKHLDLYLGSHCSAVVNSPRFIIWGLGEGKSLPAS